MPSYYVGAESGDKINGWNIVHGARYGLNVEAGEGDGTYVIDGGFYRPAED